jgi:hypothetical protein
MSATRTIAAALAMAVVAPAAAGATTADERKLVALWMAPDAVVLSGQGSDTPRTQAANMLLRGHPDLVLARFSHLRRLIGAPMLVGGRTGTWMYRLSVRPLADGGKCTRYLMVMPQTRYRIGGFLMTQERCSDHSPGRALPER